MSTLLTKLCVGEEVDFDPCQQLLDTSDCVNPQKKIHIFMTLYGLIVFIELCWSIIRGSLGREPYNEAFHATLALPMRGDIQRKDRPPDLVKHTQGNKKVGGGCTDFDEDDSSILLLPVYSAGDNEDYCGETIPFGVEEDDDDACKE